MSEKGISPTEAVRFVEFINFTPETLNAIADEWKNIPQIDTIAIEESVAIFKFNEYKAKADSDDKVLARCRAHNESLATFTMRRLKEAINKACSGYYFNLNRHTITNKRKNEST